MSANFLSLYSASILDLLWYDHREYNFVCTRSENVCEHYLLYGRLPPIV